MNRGLRIVAWLLATSGLQGASALAGDKDVVEYREHIMNTMNEQAAALGQILSLAVPDENAVAHIDAIALSAGTALKAFEPKVPGGESKAEVWSNWADFSKRMNQFAQGMARVSRMAHEQGKEKALEKILDALTCKGCHDTYREEEKR
jgi:cytochrome c556